MIKSRPRSLVIGTGASGVMKVPGKLLRELEATGMEVHVQTTDQAVETYNRIAACGGEAVAALHLTC